jgi:copper chaperone
VPAYLNRQGKSRFLGKVRPQGRYPFCLSKVPSIVCDGCADTIIKAITELDAGAKVDVNVETKEVSAQTSASESAVREAITAKGHIVE